MRTRAPVLALSVVALLAGCSASGLDARGGFACKAPEGVTCMSVSGVYETSRRNALPGQLPAAPQSSPRSDPGTAPRAAPMNPASRSAPGARRTALTSGTPLRSAPRVLRIWLAPYEDSEGDLRDQGHIYVTVDRGSWQIEHTRRAIQERFAPIRALAPVAPSSTATSAARSVEADGEAPQGAGLPDIAPAPVIPAATGMPPGGR